MKLQKISVLIINSKQMLKILFKLLTIPFKKFYRWLMIKQEMSIIKPKINEMFADPVRREQFLAKMDKQARINKYGKSIKKYEPAPAIE